LLDNPLYTAWKKAWAAYNEIGDDPNASDADIRRTETALLRAMMRCDQDIARMERYKAMVHLAATRARALSSIGDARAALGDMPDLFFGVIDSITANAELESNLIFESWQPGTGERKN